MKQNQQITPSWSKTTPNDVVRWAMELRHFHTRIAPFFARPEPRHRCLLYLQGILSDIARKNGWQLAEQAGEARPDGMQRLLSNAVWDEDLVRDEVRTYVLSHLGGPHAIAAIDAHELPQARTQVGRCPGAILRNHRAGRKLSSWCVSQLCEPKRSYPH